MNQKRRKTNKKHKHYQKEKRSKRKRKKERSTNLIQKDDILYYRAQCEFQPLSQYIFHENNDGQQMYEAESEQEIIQEADLVNQNTTNEKYVFKVGRVLVFTGTDGLPFNLLKATVSVSSARIGPRTRKGRFFLAEKMRDEGNVV